MKVMHEPVFKIMELPFVLGEEEQELVDYKDSLFILERSGTGKTTVMLSRILMRELVFTKTEMEIETTQWMGSYDS